MEKDRQEEQGGECSLKLDIQNMWKLIWGMKVPNSVKMFKWRACHNIYPSHKRESTQARYCLGLYEVEFHAEIARRIWFRRNTVVHGGDSIHPNDLILSASKSIAEYRAVMVKDVILGDNVEA